MRVRGRSVKRHLSAETILIHVEVGIMLAGEFAREGAASRTTFFHHDDRAVGMASFKTGRKVLPAAMVGRKTK